MNITPSYSIQKIHNCILDKYFVFLGIAQPMRNIRKILLNSNINWLVMCTELLDCLYGVNWLGAQKGGCLQSFD